MKNTYKIVLVLLSILLVGSILIGTSYSLWMSTNIQEGNNIVNTGCFRIIFTDTGFDGTGNINLTTQNNYPISDTLGKSLTPYKFKIENKCDVASKYSINLDTLSTSTMDPNHLKVYFYDINTIPSPDTEVPNYTNDITTSINGAISSMNLLTDGYLAPKDNAGSSATYLLRVWIDEEATTTSSNVMGKIWRGKVVVNSEATSTRS